MYQRTARHILPMGLLVALLVLAMSACGVEGAQEKGSLRPLPEDQREMPPDTYASKDFEPSLSFEVEQGWKLLPPETFDDLHLIRGETGVLGFANLEGARFYRATKTGLPYAMDVPQDIVGWFQQHPHLRTDKHQEVTVGGVPGEEFDVVVKGLPRDYSAMCGTDCVDIVRLSSGDLIAFWEADRAHVVVAEAAKGEPLIIVFGGPATEFDEFAPEARKVIDSVQWGGS
jgi:hypothetical protein